MDGEIIKQNPAEEITEALSKGYGPRIARFALAVLGGAIPFAGGVFSGAAGEWSDAEQAHFNKVFASWLQLQRDEIKEIGITIAEILTRIDLNDEQITARIESPAYLSLIKKAFRDWSAAESEEKRVMVRNLLTNGAVHKICSDDVVRMFIQWIDLYSENHFAVLKFIYRNVGCTRWEIWLAVHGEKVREDSAEADLFKLIMGEFTQGYVIRQHREKDGQGNYLKTPPRRTRTLPSRLMKSAFDDDKEYELTELGKQFVRYTMENVMPRIGQSGNTVNVQE
jgi:hypothetical protein